jgi:LysM repeat protein
MKYIRFSLMAFLLVVQSNYVLAQVKTEHTLQQGETLSALATKYNTTVGDIMRLNGMNAKSQLTIGQKIKIPSGPVAVNTNPTPVVAAEKKVEQPTSKAPITHTVVKGDNMYRLTKTYNISDVQIRQWNNMLDNNIQIGQLLVVGGVPANYKPPVQAPDIVKVAEPAKENPVTEVIKEENKPNDKVKVAEPAITKPTVIKEEKKNTDIVKVAEPANNNLPGTTNNTNAKPSATALPETPVYTEPTVVSGADKYVAKEGFFAQYFDRKQADNNTLNAEAGIFKSVSGWTDKKYYVLINDVAPGTIVRVTANGKNICAKVLGPLPAMQDDNGLRVRISNAAQNALTVDTDRFAVTINY